MAGRNEDTVTDDDDAAWEAERKDQAALYLSEEEYMAEFGADPVPGNSDHYIRRDDDDHAVIAPATDVPVCGEGYPHTLTISYTGQDETRWTCLECEATVTDSHAPADDDREPQSAPDPTPPEAQVEADEE